MTMLRRWTLAFAAALMLSAAPASATQEAEHPRDYPFSFDSPVGVYDMGAVQRGFAVYRQVCASCHSMNFLAYRHLGTPAGFYQIADANEAVQPNELTASINHERMPVLLSTNDECETWLRGSTQEAFALARSFPAQSMRIAQAGPDRNDKMVA